MSPTGRAKYRNNLTGKGGAYRQYKNSGSRTSVSGAWVWRLHCPASAGRSHICCRLRQPPFEHVSSLPAKGLT
eukprot:532043-Amphidinium_carterae.2